MFSCTKKMHFLNFKSALYLWLINFGCGVVKDEFYLDLKGNCPGRECSNFEINVTVWMFFTETLRNLESVSVRILFLRPVSIFFKCEIKVLHDKFLFVFISMSKDN